MLNLPFYLPFIFALTVITTIFLFFKAAHYSVKLILMVTIWLLMQSLLGLFGYYQFLSIFPPRLPLLIAPPVIAILLLFIFLRGRKFLNSLDTQTLTLLHIVRIPVEFVLLFLFIHKSIPQVMTFEGRNFDLFSGLTAPAIYYYGYYKKYIHKKILIGWNLICLGLVLNIVITGILAAPTPFQQLAFDQPNIAILYFPYVLLPSVIVPIVIFAHLVSIRQLLVQASI